MKEGRLLIASHSFTYRRKDNENHSCEIDEGENLFIVISPFRGLNDEKKKRA